MQNGSAFSRMTGMLTSSAFSSTVRGVPRPSGRRPPPNALTVHQVVAHNVFQARQLRGWTQEEAAAEISAALGRPLTAAGLSAIEKTFTSRRQRVIDVTELAAFARAFGLPIAWFFLPPPGREADPIPNLYEHVATMAVDVFGDEDAWQWYIARVMALIGAPRSILHDELLGSGGYPGEHDWAGIDDKREELLQAALKRFTSEHSDLVEALLQNLGKLRDLTATGHAQTYPRKHDDPFGYLVKRVATERAVIAEGMRRGERPKVSARYRPTEQGNE
jgi:transcriptional regulator with XRE-family HTH domain